MGLPYHPTAGGGILTPVATATKLVNQWAIFNPLNTNGLYGNPGPNTPTVTLGGFITAPDGTTNTMQHITEAATNTEHYLTCGYLTEMTGGYLMRLAVIAKAAERTRIGLSFVSEKLGTDGVGVGVKCVFDLAGGQIGVPPFAFGTDAQIRPSWTAAAASTVASILPLGGGVYICQMDVKMGALAGGDTGQFAGFYLDNGSGTGAASLSYSGDGTSGVYAWKSSLLPTRAWRLRNRVFFDDFTDPTMANIDLNDTRAPGFDWYVHGTWPNFAFSSLTPVPKAKISQSGSILTIGPNINPGTGIFFGTACNKGADPGNVGGVTYLRGLPGPNAANAYTSQRLFKPPMLIETSFAWGAQYNQQANNDCSIWTTPLERLYNTASGFLSQSTHVVGGYVISTENDWFEQRPGGGNPSHSSWDIEFQTYISGNYAGLPVWYSTYSYNTNGTVYYSGTVYRSLTNSNVNNIPPSTLGTQWQLFTPTAGPTTQTQIDQTQQNVYQCLWLPDPGDGSDLGQQVNFFNSTYIVQSDGNNGGYGHMTYGFTAQSLDKVYAPGSPRVNGNTTFQMGDNLTYPIWMQLPGNPETQSTLAVDYVSVITE